MTSLADVYEGQVGEHVDRRRVYAGVGLFSLGAALAIAGIVVAGSGPTTAWLGLGTAREYGGILAGIGVPAVFMGIFTVLPAGRVTRAAAVVGSGIAMLGVSLFTYAYPCRWSGAVCPQVSGDLTLIVAAVYATGVLVTFWCLFTAVVNFKSRNDPGGTVELEITRGGETKVIEVPESELDDGGTGGIGFFGDKPDGEVATQTNRPDGSDAGRTGGTGRTTPADGAGATRGLGGSGSSAGRAGSSGSGGSGGSSGSVGSGGSNESGGFFGGGTPTPDGTGAEARETGGSGFGSADNVGGGGRTAGDEGAARDVDDVSRRQTRGVTEETTAGSARGAKGGTRTDSGGSEIREVEPSEVATSPGDSYCGSCAHFRYVRTEDGMQPYCEFHDELMDDMDACPEWTQR